MPPYVRRVLAIPHVREVFLTVGIAVSSSILTKALYALLFIFYGPGIIGIVIAFAGGVWLMIRYIRGFMGPGLEAVLVAVGAQISVFALETSARSEEGGGEWLLIAILAAIPTLLILSASERDRRGPGP